MLVYDPIEKKVKTWSHAEIDGPCFVVTIISLQTGETNRAALLRCIYTLRHYLITVKGVEIEHIHMMCPPSISGKSYWIMEELLSVASYNGLETPEKSIVYRTKEPVYKIGEFDRRKKKVTNSPLITKPSRTQLRAISKPYRSGDYRTRRPDWLSILSESPAP
jgi:hypothetical protein